MFYNHSSKKVLIKIQFLDMLYLFLSLSRASHIGDIITKPETIIKIFMWSQSRMHMGDDARMMCDEDSRARHVSCFHKTYRLDRNKLTEINCMLFIL